MESPASTQASSRLSSPQASNNSEVQAPAPLWLSLLAGESIVACDGRVVYLCPDKGPSIGTLCITNYRCAFSAPDSAGSRRRIVFPLGVVHKIEKVGGQTSKGENSYGLDIICKDFRRFRFAHPQENHSRRSIFESLKTMAFPDSAGNPLFAFTHFAALPQESQTSRGWEMYDFRREMARMGVPNDSWRISTINETYKMSVTYPALMAVPQDISEEDIGKVAAFRSKGRMPALSWLHPHNRASITRSSQPRVGITEKRCKEDETLLQKIMQENPTRAKVQILDARPRANAVANKAKGLGAEPAKSYPFATLTYLNIHNIHVMRDSMKKLRDVCSIQNVGAKKNWFASVESTGWLKHVHAVLQGIVQTAKCIQNGTSVLVHCSDGWDRTAQLSGGAMLLLDPFYRTIEGFQILIAKEWLSFGHKFHQRIGHGTSNHSDEQRSPIFVQFLDCVWQIMQQFPSAFEFNEDLLITILDEMYSCRFGTFLFNCESKRLEEKINKKTLSLWDYIASDLSKYTNPLYVQVNRDLKYIPTIKCMSVWTGYYLRDSDSLARPAATRQSRAKELDVENAKLEAEVAALEVKLKESLGADE